jgi:hypothetical protein
MLQLPHALNLVIMQGDARLSAYYRQRGDKRFLSHFKSSTCTEMWRNFYESRPTLHEAELDFPISDRVVTIDGAYKAWFLQHKKTIYTRPIPGTWTRLGYTYDWGNPGHPVGESEFIVRPGAHLAVDSVNSTEDYCR